MLSFLFLRIITIDMAPILSGVSSTVYFIWLLISIATPPPFSVLTFVSVEKPFIERRLFLGLGYI